MFVARFLLVLAVLVVPAAAAESLQVHQTVCEPGTVTKRSADKVEDTRTFTKALSGFFGSTNLCTDEVVTLSIKRTGLFSGYGLLTDRITCICTKPSDLERVGCDPNKEQRRPTVTINISAHNKNCKKPVFRISKCVTDYRRAFEDACGGADLSKYVPPASVRAPLPPSSGAPVPSPEPTDAAVTEGVSRAFVPEAAETKAVLDIIAKGRSGDAGGAKATASNVVPELNQEDVKKLSDIDPEKIPPAVTAVKDRAKVVPDTFGGGPTAQAAPAGSTARDSTSYYDYSPLYYPTNYSYGSPSYPSGSPFANVNPFSNLFPFLRTLFSRGSSEPASPRPSPPPEASIVARPGKVARGNSIFVSWSSVGMSISNPCQVHVSRGGASTLLARGNAGSRTISAHEATTSGTWNFTLECTRPSGALLKREASTVVK